MEKSVEMNVGSIILEIPILLSSGSGRDKHIDIDEQGLILASWFWDYIKGRDSVGANFGPIKYWGTNRTFEGEPIKVFE